MQSYGLKLAIALALQKEARQMECNGSFVDIASKEGVIEYLKGKQQDRPFNCPHLLVVNKMIRQGNNIFEKGDMLCSSGFLDTCCLFERSQADEEGNLIARCSKVKGELMVVFRSDTKL
jgi:hypothetical protein